MSPVVRRATFAVSIAGVAALLAWGFSGLHALGDFDGRYGTLLPKLAPQQRSVGEVVSAATFDYRGFDTLGEEMILFAAAVGLLTLLRVQRGAEDPASQGEERGPTAESGSLRGALTALVGPLVVLGLYIVAHGHLTPGGGFQGGLVLASAFICVYLAGATVRHRRMRPIEAMELGEGLGAAGFVLIGLGGLITASAFLHNFIDLGRLGYPWSGGMIPFQNLAVGLAVLGATLAVLSELRDHRLLAGGEQR